MKYSGIIKVLTGATLMLSSVAAYADTFVAVDRPAKVFDSPNAKGYVTLNTKNVEVEAKPGMVFSSSENSNGWYLVEYSPGLRGYISAQTVATPVKLPSAGSYKVANRPASTIKVENDGDAWKGTIDGTIYNGKAFDKIVVLFDADNKPAYSVVDLGQGPIVMSYDNNVTGFF
ncbi:MAG: hypothetical protein K2M10_01865 [Muribaculaceae bacterium]|nr:hypothetical protein [Muribaculaceae bacterium]